MREQLQQYVALLFAGAQDCEEIQQEILQNTLDRYDDLIAQGKVPEAAYRLAISSIGDINEILNTQPKREIPSQESIANPPLRQPLAALKKKKKLLPILIAGILCLCLLALLFEVLDELPHRRRFQSKENYITETTLAVKTGSDIVTLQKAAMVYSSPSEEASVVAELSSGFQVTILRQETIAGKAWGYIDNPVLGWLILENISHNAEPLNLPPAPPAEPEVTILKAAATVYSSPSVESGGHNGELEAGTEISITRRELVNNQEWAYTTAPVQGWILAEYLEGEKITVTEPENPVTYTQPAEPGISGSSMLAETVSSISIDWVSGNISILAGEGDRIVMEETEGTYPLVWKTKGSQLSIDFCEESLMRGFRLGGAKAKDLTITVPRDWLCQDLEIDAASADLVVQDLTIQNVEIEAASGRTEFINCTVGALDMDAASGDAFFVGSLDTLEFDAAAADFTATLNNKPRQLEMSSASGSLILTIPEDTGFTVRMEGLKTIFSAEDFQVKKQNGAFIHGDGACRIEMESMSGGVHLYKAS